MDRPTRTGAVTAALLAAVGGSVLAGSLLIGGTAPHPAPAPEPTVAATPRVATVTAPVAKPVGKPTRVLIPRIGVDEGLYGVGLKPDGAMATPDFGDAGWYDLGPRPGAAGPAVIVAHVHGPAGDDVFARLHELRPGDRIGVRRTDGASVFVVDAVERAPKESLPTTRIWNDTDRPVLRLITCGGTPDPVTRMYPDNTIVYAHLAP
jgi:hypothetical protein